MAAKILQRRRATCVLAGVLAASSTIALAQAGTAITYQGELTDAGTPATGPYDFEFTLWDADTDGMMVGSAITIEDLIVDNGRFSAVLDFDPMVFDDNPDRYLQVAVRPFDSMDPHTPILPRTEIAPVPFALNLVPGGQMLVTEPTTGYTITTTGVTSAALELRVSSGDGRALEVYHDGGAGGAGIYSDANSSTAIEASSILGIGLLGRTNGNSSVGVLGQNNSFAGGVGVRGELAPTSSLSVPDNSAAVVGSAQNFTGVAGISNGDFGVHGTTNSNSANIAGVKGLSASGESPGVLGESSNKYGVEGRSGAVSTTPVPSGKAGVLGTSLAENGVTGVSDASSGVYGATKTSDANFAGVHGVSRAGGSTAAGVLGESLTSINGGAGVRGIVSSGESYGVEGISDSSTARASGVRGRANASTGLVYGVYGSSDSNNSNSAGVHGVANAGGRGVYGFSPGGEGVRGESTSDTGVYGNSSTGAAVEGVSQFGPGVVATSGNGDPIEAYGGMPFGLLFKVDSSGNVTADGTFTSPAADFAELLPAVDGLEPGDVLIVNEEGLLAKSTAAYQTSVLGVHSEKPAFLGGSPMDGNREGLAPLAVVGIVPVKVTSENGLIKPGDLLVTSSTEGHAMRCDGDRNGSVIGKALSPLKDDKGVIRMLVVLQ